MAVATPRRRLRALAGHLNPAAGSGAMAGGVDLPHNLARTNPRWARYAGYSDGTVSASAEDVVAVPEAAYELPPSLLAWPEPELPYRHQFEPEELPAAVACVRDHGFAVIKAVLEPSDVVALRRDLMAALDPVGDLATSGELRVQRTFMEHSQALLRLLANKRFIAINEALNGTDQLTLHRNGAIAKGAGSGTMSWHTDFRSASPSPDTVDAILNTGDWPNGIWFYLNGSHPSRGGLAVCADSHREDWVCPRDFVRTDRSLAPSESVAEAAAAAGEPELAPFRLAGCVPIISNPEDLVRESYFFFDSRRFAVSLTRERHRLRSSSQRAPSTQHFPTT